MQGKKVAGGRLTNTLKELRFFWGFLVEVGGGEVV